ncbi:MAG: DUF1127 domain-containing protein [Paracoccaceae bacterium]|nr:DUF1127 domain-containing protein [Paracoccaceae bacterium]
MTFITTTQSHPRHGHPIRDLSERLFDRIRAVRRRKGFKHMLELDDHMLRDIGVTRADVAYCAELPLSVDAATVLRRLSHERLRYGM